MFGIKCVFFQGFAGGIFAVAAKLLAFGYSAFGYVAVAVEGFSQRCDASAAIVGFFEFAEVTIESAIGGNGGLLHGFVLLSWSDFD